MGGGDKTLRPLAGRPLLEHVIDRLRPHDPEIAYTLAKLYAQQDLVVEARAHYLLVADSYTRANETQKALEILRQIANLDVQNTDIRIKLANAYLKEGMKQEALAAFDEAGERMLASGAFERALEVYQKSLEIDPVERRPVHDGHIPQRDRLHGVPRKHQAGQSGDQKAGGDPANEPAGCF